MLVAVVVTLLNLGKVDFSYIIAGVLVGGVVGVDHGAAYPDDLHAADGCTAHGFGGGASVAIAPAGTTLAGTPTWRTADQS